MNSVFTTNNYDNLTIRIALVMVLLFIPGLALSLWGAVTQDQAFEAVIQQGVLLCSLIIASIRSLPLRYQHRLWIVITVIFLVGAVATVRYSNPTVGYTYSLIITLLVTLLLSRSGVYALLAGMNALVGAVAVLTFDLSVVRVLLQFLTFTGLTVIGLEVVYELLDRYKASLQILNDENARQQAVSAEANIAFFEYHLESGVLNGDAVLASRFGLSDPDVPIVLSDYGHSYPEESLLTIGQEIDRLIKSPIGTYVNFMHSMNIQPSGELRQLKVVGQSIEREGKKLFVGVSMDVTDELQLSQESIDLTEQIDLVSKAGGIGLIEFFPDTLTFKCNAEVAKRLGIERSNEERSVELFYAHQTDAIRQAFMTPRAQFEASEKGELQSFVHPFYLANGDLHHYRVTRVKREVNGRVSFLGLSLDITEEYLSKVRAQESAHNLVIEQERQKQMYAVIGHELRTPAASLKMMLDDLEEGETLDNSLVSSNIEHLLGVIDTLRAVAQPERMAQAAFKDVVMDEMLTAQIANLSGLAERSGVELTADLSNLTGESVHIQSSLLRQVVANLIKNAIIHSEGDKVHLFATSELKGDHSKALTIRVSDNGKGIADSKVESLFEAYQRGDTNAEGTGLGLFVCKEIVALMEGDLHYETSELGGAEFVIELVVNLSKQTSETPEPIDNPLEGKRVLMAEDNNVIQMLTAKMLKKQGATVAVNSDGQQALEAYVDGAFDLVMSDIFMPELDGYGFVKELRERGYTGPIVGLTAATIGAETDLMLEAGADIVISKPIELSKLQAFLLEYDQQTQK